MSLPKPTGEFEWVQESWGAALRCRPLSGTAAHRFSSRELVMQSSHEEDRQSWNALGAALRVDVGYMVRMHQVHGVEVFEPPAELRTASDPAEWPQGDIAITADPSIALSVRAADCVPILLADRTTGAVAAVHAGWQGTALGAALVAVQALAFRYGVQPRNLIAAVGPSIGPCCYEVGPDLAARFSGHPESPAWFSAHERPHLDLWRATHDQLHRAGIPVERIHVCRLCTFDNPALLHSYRRDGARAGRLVAAIRSGPDTTL